MCGSTSSTSPEERNRSISARRNIIGIALSAALTLMLAACAGAGDSTADHGGGHAASEQVAEPVEGARGIEVTAVDIDFEPGRLELTAGEPVNVVVSNDGETLHDFTLQEADVHLNVEPGDTGTTSLTIDKPGTYEAECTVPGHAEAGMTIEVIVT